ncbi:MAG: cytochrome c biogenesis protein CcdA, partial [Candidatus Binatia bacterium]
VLSLAVSVTLFTLLLKATTALLGVPQEVWRSISGGIVLLIGLSFLFPGLWERLALTLNLRANEAVREGGQRHSIFGDIIIGAALGPVFTSCSPVYGLLLATVLPASLAIGTIYILLYALGLSFALLLIALTGQALIKKLGWAVNPYGWFRRILGATFILIGAAIFFGFDKLAEAWLLEQGLYDGATGLEELIRLE